MPEKRKSLPSQFSESLQIGQIFWEFYIVQTLLLCKEISDHFTELFQKDFFAKRLFPIYRQWYQENIFSVDTDLLNSKVRDMEAYEAIEILSSNTTTKLDRVKAQLALKFLKEIEKSLATSIYSDRRKN